MTATTNPNAVPRRYLEALDGADALDVLQKSAKRIRKLIRGAKRKDLEHKPSPDAWSVQQVLAHLADHEFVFGTRLRFVGALDRPALSAYDEQLFMARLGVENASAEDLCEDFVRTRAANVALLARLPESAFARVGVHAERGELTLQDLVTTNAGHDRVHEDQIARTLEAARLARRAEKAARRESVAAARIEKRAAKAAQRELAAAEKAGRRAEKKKSAQVARV